MFSFAKSKLRAIRRKWRLSRFGLSGSGDQTGKPTNKLAAAARVQERHVHRDDPLDTLPGNCQTQDYQLNKSSDRQAAGAVISSGASIDNKLALARQDDVVDTHVGLPYADAPVGVLPFDVLRIIFELDAYNSWIPWNKPSVRVCWMRLSHVCATWRFVLLDMPLLWADDVYAFGAAGGTFRAMLARAQDAPLNLDLSGNRWMYRDKEEWPRLTSALSLCTRARRLILELETDSVSPAEISALRDAVSGRPLPRLEEFSFSLHVDVSNLNSDKNATFDETTICDETPTLDGAANLRDLKLHWFYMRPPTSGSLIKLNINLSRHVERPSMDELLHVLSCNPGLVDLTLDGAFRGRSTTMHPSSVVLPLLLNCSVQNSANEPLHILLNCLRTPSVRRFHVNGEYDHSTVRAPQTPTLLQAALSVCAGSPALPDGALEIEHSTEFMESLGFGSLQIHLVSSRSESSPLEFLYHVCSVGEPSTSADDAVAHLSNAHIFERVQELQISLRSLNADTMRCWKPAIARCIGAETISSHVNATSEAAAMLGLMEEMHGEGLLLPQRWRLDLDNAWTGERLDDGSGAFQDVCGRAEKLGVALDIEEGFDSFHDW